MDVNIYPIYRFRDTRRTILVHDVELDNHWVVLHNVYLSTKYNAHTNVEVCNNIRAIKYLFKYDYKGHDCAIVSHFQNDVDAMVRNKLRIQSCMKPYVRSIPSAMGVELEVEAMSNAQKRFCHWSHVLCTLDIM
jgi:hypothetical protein